MLDQGWFQEKFNRIFTIDYDWLYENIPQKLSLMLLKLPFIDIKGLKSKKVDF